MIVIALLCSLGTILASPPSPRNWQASDHVDISTQTLEPNTIFFQEVGQTIDTIGTLHAHITLDIQRPLTQLQRINTTIHHGITAVHNQLLTFLHVIRHHEKYDAFEDHVLGNRIRDQSKLMEYLTDRNYQGLLDDVRLLTRFATATYSFALTVPQPAAELDADLQQEYVTPELDQYQPTKARLTRPFTTLIRELQQWIDMQQDIALHTQQLTPFTSENPRQKRFLPFLIAGTAILASTFLGTWNTVEIQHLKNTQHDLIVKVDSIIKQQLADNEHLAIIDKVIHYIHQDEQQLQLDMIHQQFIDHTLRQLQVVQVEVTQITQVLDGLMNYRLSS